MDVEDYKKEKADINPAIWFGIPFDAMKITEEQLIEISTILERAMSKEDLDTIKDNLNLLHGIDKEVSLATAFKVAVDKYRAFINDTKNWCNIFLDEPRECSIVDKGGNVVGKMKGPVSSTYSFKGSAPIKDQKSCDNAVQGNSIKVTEILSITGAEKCDVKTVQDMTSKKESNFLSCKGLARKEP